MRERAGNQNRQWTSDNLAYTGSEIERHDKKEMTQIQRLTNRDTTSMA